MTSTPLVTPVEQAALDAEDRGEFAGKVFLLAEDNQIFSDILATYLGRQGALVDIVADGQAGLALYLAQPNRYDIIFVDMQMPVMDGYEMASRIRLSDADRASPVPMVVMSGWPLSQTINGNIFNGLLRKPFSLEDMLSVIRQILGPSLPE